MAQKIRDIMTTDPVCVASSASIRETAKLMKDHDIGDVIVQDGGKVAGIVTDRDIVVRGVAADQNVRETSVASICSRQVVTVRPDDEVDVAIQRMHENAVRRIPVVENGKPVGVVSLGDLAVARDRRSVLGSISAAEPSH